MIKFENGWARKKAEEIWREAERETISWDDLCKILDPKQPLPDWWGV